LSRIYADEPAWAAAEKLSFLPETPAIFADDHHGVSGNRQRSCDAIS